MKSRLIAGILLCFGMGIALVPSAMADAVGDARKSITAALNKMSNALNNKDAVGYAQFFADDIVIIGRKGQIRTKQQSIENSQRVCQSAKSIKTTNTIEKFSLQKGKAIVTTREKATIVLPNPRTKKDSQIALDSLQESVWVKSGTVWKIKKTRDIATKMMVDGKPVALPK